MRAAPLVLVTLLAACDAPAQRAEVEPAAPKEPEWLTVAPPECDIQVVLGSNGGGPDFAVRERLVALTKADPGVLAVSVRPWGREGESTHCIRTKDAAATDRIYDTIAPLIPEVSERTWSAIAHKDGRFRRTKSSTEAN